MQMIGSDTFAVARRCGAGSGTPMDAAALTQKSTRRMPQSLWSDQTRTTRTAQLALMSRPTLVSSLPSSAPAGGQELP